MHGLILTLSHLDERLLVALLERRRPRLDRVMRAATRLGDAHVIVAVAGALAWEIVPGMVRAGRWAVASLVLSHLLVQVLKRTICRQRPSLPVGLAFLIDPEDRFSFPSGHATAGMSVALPLFVSMSVGVGAVVLLLGMLVGVSRCYLGVHYPGDVLVGWCLATLSVVAVPLLAALL